MTKLKINVTKDILEKSKYCGYQKGLDNANTNCAIAHAVRDIFPEAYVTYSFIYFKASDRNNIDADRATLPQEASDFIESFDLSHPSERVDMDELEFEIEVPTGVIDSINIDEVRKVLKNHPTLELTHRP